jgi:Short C-terminal domain
MGFFDSLKGFTGGVDERLLENGTPGTAVCTSIQDTGVSMNEDLVVKFGLRIEVPGQAPYEIEHRQRVPRILMAQVSAGAVYAVKVDPSDPNRVAIDWNSAPAPPEGAIPMGGNVVGQPEYESAAAILASGAPGTATLQSAQQLPMTSPEGWPLYLLSMTVQLEGGAPQPVQNGQKVPPDQTARMVPGTQLPVKADPANPMKCAIDWEQAGSAPAAPSAGAEDDEDDPLDRIKKLQELRESGALTDAEFQAQKAKLLADI